MFLKGKFLIEFFRFRKPIVREFTQFAFKILNDEKPPDILLSFTLFSFVLRLEIIKTKYMNTTISNSVLTSDELLKNWQGNRALTRRIIEAFPEKELFEFSIGGMRTFAELTKELLAIAVPGMIQIVTGEETPFDEKKKELNSKEALLKAWDESTPKIEELWTKMQAEKFKETINLFGQYEYPVIDSIFYFIENEIHHRGQGYVYLRALGIEPPFFWER